MAYVHICLLHPRCPSILSYTHARRTFDRALRTLPPSLHSRIWTQYLLWAEKKGGETTVRVYRRYLAIDPSLTERFNGYSPVCHKFCTPAPGSCQTTSIFGAQSCSRGIPKSRGKEARINCWKTGSKSLKSIRRKLAWTSMRLLRLTLPLHKKTLPRKLPLMQKRVRQVANSSEWQVLLSCDRRWEANGAIF